MADTTAALTSKIVTAYLRGNSLSVGELPGLIQTVHTALVQVSSPEPQAAVAQVPAVPVKKSITPDAVFCLECGKAQQMLKRHLNTGHGLTVDEYRAKWNLPSDYPVVAPNYAQRRSEFALQIGLGRKSGSGNANAAVPSEDAGKPSHQYPPSRWSRPTE